MKGDNMIRELERQSILLYNLLLNWAKYVSILKMDRRMMETYQMMEEDMNNVFYKGQKQVAIEDEQMDQHRVSTTKKDNLSADEELTSQSELEEDQLLDDDDQMEL